MEMLTVEMLTVEKAIMMAEKVVMSMMDVDSEGRKDDGRGGG